MDCLKQTRASALFPPVNCVVSPEIGGRELAFSSNPVVVRSALVKLPATFMLAVLPAIVLVCGIFIASRTAQGQSYQGAEGAEKAGIQQLIEQLNQTDFELREAAQRKLIEIGSPAVDPLVSTLLDCTPDVCSRVKQILQAVAVECDEESVFKVLAALQIRFEVPAERVKQLLDRWAIHSRGAVVARWREQGAIVMDPLERTDPLNQLAEINDLEHQMRIQMAQQQAFRFEVKIKEADLAKSQALEDSPQAKERDQSATTQSIAERLQLVLDESLKRNKKLVLKSGKGAAGFERSLAMLQEQPVSVVIGEDWRGDYSDFDFTEPQTKLLIDSFEVQKKVIDDSLLTVLNQHPVVLLTLNQCSIASDVKQTFPASLSSLVIEGANDSSNIFQLVSDDSPGLSRVRFVNSKFGKTQALALQQFRRLTIVELVRIDLDEKTFDGLASLRRLRRVWLERCKFPAAAFLEFQQERRDIRVEFTAKAFLGVSSDPGRLFGRGRQFKPPAADTEGCVVATVVPGEAADRAGMEAGDEILTVGGQKVKSFEELRIAIAQCEIGEEVPIEIRRDGKDKTLKATMGIPDDLK